MAAKLTWDGRILDLELWPGVGVDRVGMIRMHERVAIIRMHERGVNYEFITNVGERRVSAPYQTEADARQDCESEVRRLLKEAGVDLAP